MFTGIVEEVGQVKAIGNGTLQIQATKVLEMLSWEIVLLSMAFVLR